jgi:glycosyltransferase involved in cell wall biosynthesis
MKKLKNLIILYPSFDSGGVTTNLINFINYSIKKKINIYLISDIKKKDQKKFFPKKVNFINVKNNSYNFISKRLITSLLSIFLLYKLFKRLQINTSITLSFQSHIMPIIMCRILRRKIVIRNSEDAIEATKYADKKFFAYFILILKLFFYNLCNGIITNSNKSQKSLQKITFNKNKIKLIFNPCLKKIIKNKKILRGNFILSVGRLCKQKNQEMLIKAFPYFLKKFPNYKLIVVGHGYNEVKLKKLCIDLNIKNNVLFYGQIHKPEKYYKRSKLLILPSLYEGLPNVLIEAVNFGLPCISTNCSGSMDILTKKYGIFVSKNNHKSLAKKMIFSINNYKKILSDNQKIKQRLNRFLIEPQASKYLVYCSNILNNNS